MFASILFCMYTTMGAT
ncbi:hypothetical protein B4U80_04314 [Leptotrombidium deliense]|uniref:Uncharacterized protein n=1 Tax=Leptotrombidium deliense TaxID=299467 RepID=A0A443S557_9ACAR|nr:hypothetical protein B4U80_04314 [Leptotrombidium deliense]